MGILQTDRVFVLSADQYRTAAAPPVGLNPGYAFDGWYDNPSGEGTGLPARSLFTPSTDTEFFANWKKSERKITIYVYSYNNDYTLKITDPTGKVKTLKNSKNTITLSKIDETHRLTVLNAPGLIIEPGEDETFGGESYKFNNDGKTSAKTYKFTPSECTELYITKLPVGQQFYLYGKYHYRTNIYNTTAGTLFGGHIYQIHWYDELNYDPNKQSFVHIAHNGNNKKHVVRAWIGFMDETNKRHDVYLFQHYGLKKDYYGTFYMTNKRQDGYNPYGDLPSYCTVVNTPKSNITKTAIQLDLRGKKRTDKFTLGLSVVDDNDGCKGIRFSAHYKVEIKPNE